jgi:uncharacterized protein (DUF3820 family)
MPHRSSFIGKNVISTNEKIEDITLSFGKYKGKSLIESFNSNPNYFVWVRQKFDFSKSYNQKLKIVLDKLIDKHIAHGK